jgi:type 1 fimbria pilin
MTTTHIRQQEAHASSHAGSALKTATREPSSGYLDGFFRRRGRTSLQGMGGLLLILLLLGLTPRSARADCSFDRGYSSTSVSFSPSSTILVPFDFIPNAVLYTSSASTPANPPKVSCSANTGYGVVNPAGAPTGSGANIVYPTVVPGLGYILVHADAPTSSMVPYAQGSNGNADTDSSFSVATTMQLIQTGPIANGSVLPAGQFASWQWGSIAPEVFTLSNSVTFVSPGCTVITSNIFVILPAVTPAALPSNNSVAGKTPFNIQLSCPNASASTKLYIQFDATSVNTTTYKTVIKNTGSATNVGVQLLNGATAVTFGSATKIGNSIASGLLTLPYFAQYYRTGAISSGGVNATATFTITYQ